MNLSVEEVNIVLEAVELWETAPELESERYLDSCQAMAQDRYGGTELMLRLNEIVNRKRDDLAKTLKGRKTRGTALRSKLYQLLSEAEEVVAQAQRAAAELRPAAAEAATDVEALS